MVASPFGKQGSQATGKKLCNCKNSRCLKLYCECFASGRFCDNCNCSKCANNEAHSSQRTAAVQQILERNPHAFRPKVPDGVQSSKHSKGCNCRKSGCLKKYCECFQAGVVCSDNCKCNDCKNFEGSVTRANVLQYLEDREQGVNVTPSKRQRVEPVLEAGKQERVPRAASGSTVGHSGTVAGRPGVLQGVLTPDAIWELCKLLLFSVNEVATHAGQRAAREAAAGAVAVPPAATTTQGNSIPSGVGERGGEDQLEASLYCNEDTEELGMGREASGRAATIPPAAALDPALLYEQQEGRVLKEFLETMQSIVTLGEQRAQQLQPHQRVLFPDMGQPSSSAAAGGVQHTHARPKSDAAHASSQHAWESALSQIHQQQQQALISDLQWPANALTPFAAIAPSRLQRGDAAASLPLPFALLNGPSEEMQALKVMHNGQLILIPTSNASLVAMPQGSALQQRIASSPATGRQAPRVGSGSGPSTAVVPSLPVPKDEPGMVSTGAPERGALTSPSSFEESTVHPGRDSLPNGRTRKHERGL